MRASRAAASNNGLRTIAAHEEDSKDDRLMFGQDVMSNPTPVPATADREQAHNPDSRAFGALDASSTLVRTPNMTEVTLRTGDDTRGQVASSAYSSPAVPRATHVLPSRPSAMNCKRTWLSSSTEQPPASTPASLPDGTRWPSVLSATSGACSSAKGATRPAARH